VLGDSREHAWADLLAFMKGEDEVRPAISVKGHMGARLALDLPANLEQSAKGPTTSPLASVEKSPCLKFENIGPVSLYTH
jgi:hypothetical protein